MTPVKRVPVVRLNLGFLVLWLNRTEIHGSQGLQHYLAIDTAIFTRFHIQNQLMYRDFGNGIREAAFADRSTAGVGIYGDPGGAGLYGDPGLNCRRLPEEDLTPSTNLQAVLAVAKGLPFHEPKETPNPKEIFHRFGINPGLKWDGQSIIGIRAVRKDNGPGPSEMNLFANAQAVEFMREYSKEYSFSPIEQGGSTLDAFREIIGASSKDQVIQAVPINPLGWGSRCQGKPQVPNSMRIEPDGVALKLNVEGQEFLPSDRGGGTARNCLNELVELKLNAKGAAAGNDQFYPITRVKGKTTGEYYDIEVNPYVDLAKIDLSLPQIEHSKEDLNTAFAKAAESQSKRLKVVIRNEESGDEQEVVFVAP